jgi:hypothetical protein
MNILIYFKKLMKYCLNIDKILIFIYNIKEINDINLKKIKIKNITNNQDILFFVQLLYLNLVIIIK